MRYLPNGNAVTSISLATSESWKDKQTGQQQERTEWHRVVFFGRLAEIAGEYLRKGSQAYIEGTLRTRKWQGQDGQDHWTTEVVVDRNGNLQLLGSAPSQSANASPSSVVLNGRNSSPRASSSPPRSRPPTTTATTTTSPSTIPTAASGCWSSPSRLPGEQPCTT